MELQQSTVLVTGATGNVGPYVTDSLVDSGADVVGTSVTEAEREDIETRAEHADAVSYHQVDLTDRAAVEALAETVADEHGSVDRVVGLDARVTAVAPFLIDVPGNREAMPDTDFSEWTAPEAVVDEVIHPLSNAGATGRIVQPTGGQPEVED
ncbi:MAG: SDR family NAD(P)-dependent oxidoreductase [Halanaeroarchaeum sp.]